MKVNNNVFKAVATIGIIFLLMMATAYIQYSTENILLTLKFIVTTICLMTIFVLPNFIDMKTGNLIKHPTITADLSKTQSNDSTAQNSISNEVIQTSTPCNTTPTIYEVQPDTTELINNLIANHELQANQEQSNISLKESNPQHQSKQDSMSNLDEYLQNKYGYVYRRTTAPPVKEYSLLSTIRLPKEDSPNLALWWKNYIGSSREPPTPYQSPPGTTKDDSFKPNG